MLVGKQIRMERIMDRASGKTIIVPMDHGVTVGPIPGIVDMAKSVDSVANGGANAVVGHVGLPLYGHRHGGKDVGLILHLSASTALNPDPNNKVLVNSVERALKMGADGVSIHVNIGAENESDMLRDFGHVANQCMEWGMPLLAMMYPRGPKIKKQTDVEVVKLAARVGAEIGADLIKTSYTGDPDSFAKVVEGCPAPVIIAGGDKMDTDKDILEMVYWSIQAGGKGVSIGRNIFQHEAPDKIVKAMNQIIFHKATVKEALEILEK